LLCNPPFVDPSLTNSHMKKGLTPEPEPEPEPRQ